MKGLFITFEGVECAGKSLQSSQLLSYCEKNNIPAILVREPGSTQIGEKLREILLHEYCTPLAEFLLFSASRTQLTETIIKPALENNTVVISDRYFHSSLVYQGYGRKIDLGTIQVISEIATLGLEPDKTFLLQPSYENVLKRLQQKQKHMQPLDRIEQENKVFHKSIYQGFTEIAQQYHYILHIDGDQSPEIIHQNIIHELSKLDTRFQI